MTHTGTAARAYFFGGGDEELVGSAAVVEDGARAVRGKRLHREQKARPRVALCRRSRQVRLTLPRILLHPMHLPLTAPVMSDDETKEAMLRASD
jgi:hypothetical protein